MAISRMKSDLVSVLSPLHINRIRVCAIQAPKGTALQKYDEPEPRPVEGTHTFVGMYSYHTSYMRSWKLLLITSS